ncbi:Mov34/MPN/PAD-1 family protein [Pseudomonas protegens]|uniref:Mov34/MPN/PAD-1 family protein n=1 Tax=Pseudomonas protegens TaxID=380021 RepID=UPI00301E493B
MDSQEKGGSEFIVIDAGDGTVDAGNKAGIRRRERLAIGINPNYRVPVVVYTLRKDFPLLSHQHPPSIGGARVLCLYDSTWSTVERSWTPQRFIARMFWWLRESAMLRLHRDDQPLEQLFYMSPYQLILPSNYPDYAKAGSGTLTIFKVDEGDSLILRAEPSQPGDQSKSVRMVPVMVKPVGATTLAGFPETLGKLQDQLVSWGSDLYNDLYDTVYDAIEGGISPAHGKGEGILITVWVPRVREGGAERIDVAGYMLNASLFDLATALDMLGLPDGKGLCQRIRLLGGPVGSAWRSLALMPVEIRTALTPQTARDLSGTPEEQCEIKGVLAGVGALGSVLADLWMRQGWGQWTFIDPDRLMPHNLCRHIAFDTFVGLPKVNIMRDLAVATYPNWKRPHAINRSILDDSAEVTSSLTNAGLIVDVTTTFEVPRELARRDDAARTVSLFVTPSGLSSVMILEDEQRLLRVDGLEGQYYRAILRHDWGHAHLANHLGDRWVGGGCRDISVRLSGDYIHLHAGILARQLRQSAAKPQARICVWESDDQSGAMSAHEIETSAIHSVVSAGWTVKYDDALVAKLFASRQEALPNETGGAILGVTDLKTKTIIIVDVLPAPPDSEASPSHFVRGKEGQAEALAQVHARTARVVDYVGEWHSHPDGCPAQPSPLDEHLLDTLHRKMSAEGLPALMVIASKSEVGVFVR